MENKNNSSISNRISLIETYNESLNEDLISKAALEGKLIASELEGYLKMMMKDGKISTELTNAGIRTSEELLTALKGNRLTSTLKGSLELSILKSNTKNAKLIDLATESIISLLPSREIIFKSNFKLSINIMLYFSFFLI